MKQVPRRCEKKSLTCGFPAYQLVFFQQTLQHRVALALMGMVVGLLMSTSTVAVSPATHCTGPSGITGSLRAAKGVKMNGPFASPMQAHTMTPLTSK